MILCTDVSATPWAGKRISHTHTHIHTHDFLCRRISNTMGGQKNNMKENRVPRIQLSQKDTSQVQVQVCMNEICFCVCMRVCVNVLCCVCGCVVMNV